MPPRSTTAAAALFGLIAAGPALIASCGYHWVARQRGKCAPALGVVNTVGGLTLAAGTLGHGAGAAICLLPLYLGITELWQVRMQRSLAA